MTIKTQIERAHGNRWFLIACAAVVIAAGRRHGATNNTRVTPDDPPFACTNPDE
jgi:hypothetical protein